METIFLLSGAVSLLVVALLLRILFVYREREDLTRIVSWFSSIGLGYFILFIMSLLWFFEVLSYDSEDFLFIYLALILIQTLILYRVFYYFLNRKHLFYLLFVYVLSFALSFLLLHYSFIILLNSSFLIVLILSMYMVFAGSSHRKIGYAGVFYSGISLLAYTFAIFDSKNIFVYSVISSLIFAIFAFIFFKQLKNCSIVKKYEEEIKSAPIAIILLRSFIFILVFSSFISLSVIGIHEFGHVALSKFYDCKSRTILFEEGKSPYSEVLCNDLSGKVLVTLAGPLLPILIAIIIFIVGGVFLREAALIIIGFNLIASTSDFQSLGVPKNIIVFSLIFGLILIVIAIILLSRSRTNEEYLKLGILRNFFLV